MTNGQAQKTPTVGAIAFSWWRRLQPGTELAGGRGGDPGALARLRRVSLVDAAIEEVTVDLARRLAQACNLPPNLLFERAALIAAVLAHVRANDVRRVAAAAGKKIGEDRHVVHPLRL